MSATQEVGDIEPSSRNELLKMSKKRQKLYGKQLQEHISAKDLKALENLKEMMIIDWERACLEYRHALKEAYRTAGTKLVGSRVKLGASGQPLGYGLNGKEEIKMLKSLMGGNPIGKQIQFKNFSDFWEYYSALSVTDNIESFIYTRIPADFLEQETSEKFMRIWHQINEFNSMKKLIMENVKDVRNAKAFLVLEIPAEANIEKQNPNVGEEIVEFEACDVNPWGIKTNWKTWQISHVIQGEQGHRKGVELGWKITAVNDVRYDKRNFKDAFKQILKLGPQCEMVFEIPKNGRRKVLAFEPNKQRSWGIIVNWDDFSLKGVQKGKQGALLGAQKGWRIKEINKVGKKENISLDDEDFDKAFRAILKIGANCVLTFKKGNYANDDQEADIYAAQQTLKKLTTADVGKEVFEMEANSENPWGLRMDWKSWTISAVVPGKQADSFGIKLGWALRGINSVLLRGNDFNAALKELLKCGPACSIVFENPNTRDGEATEIEFDSNEKSPWGMLLKWDDWTVRTVYEGFQGQLSGVQTGWKILEINNVAQTENISLKDADFALVFKTLLKIGPKCKLTFMKSAPVVRDDGSRSENLYSTAANVVELSSNDTDPWGIAVNWNTWTIRNVLPDKQGFKKGVRKGFRIKAVNHVTIQGKDYKAAFKELLKCGPKCKLTFSLHGTSKKETLDFEASSVDQWGMKMNWDEWVATKVDVTSQAYKNGVRVGWKVHSVNKIKIEEKNFLAALRQFLKTGSSCVLTFADPDEDTASSMQNSQHSLPKENEQSMEKFVPVVATRKNQRVIAFEANSVKPWGLATDWKTFTVSKVFEGKQGEENGVERGWRILGVNHVKFKNHVLLEEENFEDVIQSLLRTGPKCKITFIDPKTLEEKQVFFEENSKSKWGLETKWYKWEIGRVVQGLQADQKGVKPKWRILAVNDVSIKNKSTRAAFKALLKTGPRCVLTFETDEDAADGRASKFRRTSAESSDHAIGDLKESNEVLIKFSANEKKPWGIKCDWNNWTINKVIAEQQAEQKGIEAGWEILAVNNVVLKERNFDAAFKALLRAGPRCTMTFQTKESEKITVEFDSHVTEPWGIKANWGDFKVIDVFPCEQAHKKGVKIGWKVIAINKISVNEDEADFEGCFKALLKSGPKCKILFRTNG